MKNSTKHAIFNSMSYELKLIELQTKHRNEIRKVSDMAAQRAITLLIPILSTSLHETYGFGEEKQKKCIQNVLANLKMANNENIIEWEEYKVFCEKKGKKCFVEIQDEI